MFGRLMYGGRPIAHTLVYEVYPVHPGPVIAWILRLLDGRWITKSVISNKTGFLWLHDVALIPFSWGNGWGSQ